MAAARFRLRVSRELCVLPTQVLSRVAVRRIFRSIAKVPQSSGAQACACAEACTPVTAPATLTIAVQKN